MKRLRDGEASLASLLQLLSHDSTNDPDRLNPLARTMTKNVNVIGAYLYDFSDTILVRINQGYEVPNNFHLFIFRDIAIYRYL